MELDGHHVTKSKVLDTLVEWRRRMELQTGRQIKLLKSDNGEEYKSDPFLQLNHDEGIERYFTVRETPQQNGWQKNLIVLYWRIYGACC